ncbi:MAG: molybdopterin-dependent oxidoreductase, partial [Eggerthellaceae bacterium]|nr:molybdopterin-dependent oxidoreductase [Eggerthellaceae bacterium]
YTFSNSIPVPCLPEVIKTGKWMGADYPIKVCIMAASTAPMGNTNSKEFLEAFNMLDFVVVEDVEMSPNARLLADIVLPAAHPFERNCVHYSGIEYEIPFAPKMVEPAFEAVSDAQIVIDIAKAMGHGDVMPANQEEALAQCFLTEPYISAGVTVENLRKQHTIRYMPKGLIYPAGAYTPTGRCELYVETPTVRIEMGLNPDSSHMHMAELSYPLEAWPGTEAQKKYPLVFMYGRNAFRFHGTGHDGAWVNEIEGGPQIRINPEDAAERGIANGELVEFYNDRGHVVIKAYLDAGIKKGIVTYDSKGLRPDQYVEGDPSLLMQNYIDPFAVNQSFFDCTCEMRPWKEGR